MAQGLAALQAVLAGKRIRPIGNKFWWSWDEDHTDLVNQHGDYLSNFRSLFTLSWEIESDPPMTFFDANKAMKRGEVVELPQGDGAIQYRIRGGSYEMRELEGDGSLSSWEESMVGLDCVEATTWRLAGASFITKLEDELPTVHEAAEWMAAEYIGFPDRGMRYCPTLAQWSRALKKLESHYPSMFKSHSEMEDFDAYEG